MSDCRLIQYWFNIHLWCNLLDRLWARCFNMSVLQILSCSKFSQAFWVYPPESWGIYLWVPQELFLPCERVQTWLCPLLIGEQSTVRRAQCSSPGLLGCPVFHQWGCIQFDSRFQHENEEFSPCSYKLRIYELYEQFCVNGKQGGSW